MTSPFPTGSPLLQNYRIEQAEQPPSLQFERVKVACSSGRLSQGRDAIVRTLCTFARSGLFSESLSTL
jgi:hypothetical protein